MTDASLFPMDDAKPAEPTTASSTRRSNQSQSLYRKYRPQTLAADDLFGQEHVVNTLRNAIALDRIAHAYLFCGPRGTGKTTTARLMAKAVNCLDPDPQRRPCNECAACVAINNGSTTDVIEIDAASNRGIDDIRDLRERVKYTPTQLTTKFYIIDEAHQITGAAANAFLKTLEEPPQHTKFILATTDPEELLQTIVSRCQRFDFRRINRDAMMACLRKVATLEEIAIDDEALLAITRHATGSLRDGLGLLDQVAVYREREGEESAGVTVDLVRAVLGVSRNDRVESLARALADRDAGAGLQVITDAVEAGDDIRQLGRQLVAYVRVLMLQRAGGTADADATAVELASRFEIQELADLARLFADIDIKIKHASLTQLPLEIALVEGTLRGQRASSESAAALQSSTAPLAPRDEPSGYAPPERNETASRTPGTSLKARVQGRDRNAEQPTEIKRHQPSQRDSVPRSIQDGPPPVTKRASAPPPMPGQPPTLITSDPGAIPIERVIDRWAKIKADVKAINRRIEALLQQVDPVTVRDTKLYLVTPYEFHRNRMNSEEVRTIVEDVVSRIFERPLQVACVSTEEAQALHSTSRPMPVRTEPPPAASQERSAATPTQPPPEIARPAQAGEEEASPEQRHATETSDSVSSDEDGDSDRAQVVRSAHDVDDATSDQNAEATSADNSDDDARVIRAAQNIFDGEIIPEDRG